MAQKVGGILLDIQTNVGKVRKDFDTIKGNLSKFSNDSKRLLRNVGLSLGAAFSVRAIKNFIVEGAKTIDTIQDMAQASGLAARQWQGLVQAARYAGVEQNGVAQAVKRLNSNIRDANYELAESVRIFEELDIEYKNAQGGMRATGAVLADIADRFREMDDSSQKAALAAKALGRSGTEMIPVMNQGAEGLEKITDRLERFGGIVNDETLEAMDAVNQNLQDMGKALEGIKLQILSGMADELETITSTAVQNAEAAEIIEKIGNAIGHLGIWIAKVGVGFAGFMDMWGSFLGMLSAQVSLGPLQFFDAESNRKMAEELSKIAQKWGQILEDLTDPAPARNLDDTKKKLKEITLLMEGMKIEGYVTVWEGMKDGFNKYYDSVKNRHTQIVDAVTSGMKSMEDALVDFVMTGKMQWRNLADSIISDIMRILIRQSLIMPLMGAVGFSGAGGQAGAPAATGGAKRGRRTYPGSAADSSTNLRNIVAENTYQMGSDVEQFVQSSERLFNRLGRTLRRNLSLTGRAGVIDPGGIPVTGVPGGGQIGYGGGALPGGSISGIVPGGGGIDLGPVSSVSDAIRDPTPGNIAEAIKDTNIIPVVTEATVEAVKDVGEKAAEAIKDIAKGSAVDVIAATNIVTAATDAALDIGEAVIDGVLGKGTADKAVDEVSDFMKDLGAKLAAISGDLRATVPGFSSRGGGGGLAFGANLMTWPLALFHGGGVVGGSNFKIPRLHNGMAPDEMLAILQRGEEVIPKNQAGRGSLTINVPVTMGADNPAMARDLRNEIERVVLDVVRRYS